MHGRSGDPDAKNRVLSHLLRRAVEDSPEQDLAVQLLILALWPGLSAFRRRLRARGRGERHTLDGAILGQLAISIRRADPDRVTRVAATLLRNTERDVVQGDTPTTGLAQSFVNLDDITYSLAAPEPDRPDRVFAGAVATLGGDGRLLCAVHLAGWSQKDVARHLGLGHEATRKRCQRALARLQRMVA